MSRRPHRSRRKSRRSRRALRHRRCASAASGMAVSTFGSGIEPLMVGSRKASTASASTLRPARMRASNSGISCRCAIASARAAPRSSSRSRQARPVAEFSTPRKRRFSVISSFRGRPPVRPEVAGPMADSRREPGIHNHNRCEDCSVRQLYSNLSSLRCSAMMRRTVPLAERITTVSVSITPWPNLTPRNMRPSVTPVAANRQSPRTMSSI